MQYPNFTTRTKLLEDLAGPSALGKPYGLCHRPVVDETTIAELKRIRCEFDTAIAQAAVPQPTLMESACQALNKMFDDWFLLEERIIKGRAFILANPDEIKALALLTTLTDQAETARRRYEMANATYTALHNEEEIR